MINLSVKTSYAEIRSNFVDTSKAKKGIVERHIDAWSTNNGNRQGRVIAIVRAKKAKPENIITVIYREEEAKKNTKVKQLVHLAIEDMKCYKF